MSRLRGLERFWWIKNPVSYLLGFYRGVADNCISYFNGTTAYAVSASRIIDLDAVDPSFEITMWRDLSQIGTLCSQNISGTVSNREFQIYTNEGLTGVLGGQDNPIMTSAECSANAGFGVIKIRYEHPSATCFVYKNGVLIKESSGVVIGASREPTAKFKYMARSNGTIDNQVFFATGDQKNVSIVHNSLNIFLPMSECDTEEDGTILYTNTKGDSDYDAVGYNVTTSIDAAT